MPEFTVKDARDLARIAHSGQTDKRGRDYFRHHLEPVADTLSPLGSEAEMAGYLHDIIEDTSTTYADLETLGVPERVIRAVRSVTRQTGETYEALITRACEDPLGTEVKLADNLINLLNNPGLAATDTRKAGALLSRYVTARDRLIEARTRHHQRRRASMTEASSADACTPETPTTSQPLQSPDGQTGVATPQKGDWVLVWAQVVNPDPHPDEIDVHFRSHNADYTGLVRRDRVTIPSSIPAFAEKCHSLYEVVGTVDGWNEPVLLRCPKHAGHAGQHGTPWQSWTDGQTEGYFEDR